MHAGKSNIDGLLPEKPFVNQKTGWSKKMIELCSLNNWFESVRPCQHLIVKHC